jgi:hypothetical protein
LEKAAGRRIIARQRSARQRQFERRTYAFRQHFAFDGRFVGRRDDDCAQRMADPPAIAMVGSSAGAS